MLSLLFLIRRWLVGTIVSVEIDEPGNVVCQKRRTNDVPFTNSDAKDKEEQPIGIVLQSQMQICVIVRTQAITTANNDFVKWWCDDADTAKCLFCTIPGLV